MNEAQIREIVPGAAGFIEWFGCWPQFHDSEVVRCDLQRAGESAIHVHTFNMTSEVDDRGRYVLDKHALVRFFLTDIESLELYDFNAQNALFGLRVEHSGTHFKMSFDPSYGLSGTITAKQLRLEWARSKPHEEIGRAHV